MKNLEQIIRDCAFTVRKHFGPGYLESVYHNALLLELRSAGLYAEKEAAIPVYYKGVQVGDFRADILVERNIIIEIKAVDSIHPIHEAQVVNYLVSTGLDFGFLINYGADEYRIIRKSRKYIKKDERVDIVQK